MKMCDHSEDVDELSASDDSELEEQHSRAPFDPELDDDDDDDETSGDGVVSTPAAQTSFSLKGGSSAFSDRSHSIFDCLDTSLSSSTLTQDNVTHKEFVQPQPPHNRKTSPSSPISPAPPKKKGVPDYLLHPERWTHYSLEDVAETSDHDNRRAAHQFLSSLQQEKQTDSPCDVQEKMIFSRPKRPLKMQIAGQLSTVRGNQSEMHLSHLEEQEDEKEGSELGKARGRGKAQSEAKRKKIDVKKDGRKEIEKPEQEKQMEKEKDDEEEKREDVNCGFASFKKTKTKNYRKSSEKGDN